MHFLYIESDFGLWLYYYSRALLVRSKYTKFDALLIEKVWFGYCLRFMTLLSQFTVHFKRSTICSHKGNKSFTSIINAIGISHKYVFNNPFHEKSHFFLNVCIRQLEAILKTWFCDFERILITSFVKFSKKKFDRINNCQRQNPKP